jgi:hypothetical protein
MNSADDLNFTREKMKVSEEEMKEIQNLILSNLSN